MKAVNVGIAHDWHPEEALPRVISSLKVAKRVQPRGHPARVHGMLHQGLPAPRKHALQADPGQRLAQQLLDAVPDGIPRHAALGAPDGAPRRAGLVARDGFP